MSSDPTAVQDALSERAAFPGNFNPATGKWESVDGNKKLRTKLVFHPETKKLMAVTAQDAASNMDKALAIEMAISGFFNLYVSPARHREGIDTAITWEGQGVLLLEQIKRHEMNISN